MKSAIEIYEAPGLLRVTLVFRRQWSGMAFGVLWLLGWWGTVIAGYFHWEQIVARYGPVRTWMVLATFTLIGCFVLLHFAGMLIGYRRYEIFKEGISVTEKRIGASRRTQYSADQIKKLRPFPGSLERMVFDYRNKVIGFDLPLTDDERRRVLAHPESVRFIEKTAH